MASDGRLESFLTRGVNRVLATPLSFRWLDESLFGSLVAIRGTCSRFLGALPLAGRTDLESLREKAAQLEQNLGRLSHSLEEVGRSLEERS